MARFGKVVRRMAAPPPEPPADPFGLGLYFASDATDNGTTLSIPNRLGGAAATASGPGRPVKVADAFAFGRPGIDFTDATVPLSAPLTAAGSFGLTVYSVLYGGGTADPSQLWAYGVSPNTQRATAQYNTAAPVAFGRFKPAKTCATPIAGTLELTSAAWNGALRSQPRVVCNRYDINADNLEVLYTLTDEALTSFVDFAGPQFSTGPFGAGPMVLGSAADGSTPFPGVANAWYVSASLHTDEQVAEWTSFLQYFIGTQNRAQFMWTGDSITEGQASLLGGFRKPTQDIYDANGDLNRWYMTIGSLPLTVSGTKYPQDYCTAAGGWKIQDVSDWLAGSLGIGPGKNYHPNILPLLIGTNDISTTGLTGIAAAYLALLQQIATLEPNCLIVAQKLLPRTDNPTWAADVATFNASILPSVVATAQGMGIWVILDDTIATAPGVTLSDGLHPTQAGYLAIATAIQPATWAWYLAWLAGP